jgi:hypothetical protein
VNEAAQRHIGYMHFRFWEFPRTAPRRSVGAFRKAAANGDDASKVALKKLGEK